MRRIKCIDNYNYRLALTEGKYYDLIDETKFDYLIRDDRRVTNWIPKNKFERELATIENEREFTLNEILSSQHINKIFKMIGDNEPLKVRAISDDDIVITGKLGVPKPVTKKLLNARFTRVESFEVGEVVKSRRTSKFYEIERVNGKNIECRNGGFSTVTFTAEEITKVNPETLKELEYIFSRKSKRVPF